MIAYSTKHSGRLARVAAGEPCFWANDSHGPASCALSNLSVGFGDIVDAEARLARWAPVLARLFPELGASGGIIESPLIAVASIEDVAGCAVAGRALIKADHALPVAGSIKARGGIYEVLAWAERIGVKAGLMELDGDLSVLATPAARKIFSRWRLGVGSTGNLGLSIGIMGSALGFATSVHMSADAKAWKKTRLRARGVDVVEHAGDYATAVAAGRAELDADPFAHFVDDENSLDLLLGYSVAALRLERQLGEVGIAVDAQHPLFVYLPCGVGGAPGGITLGLKYIYGDAAHCFFAEPVMSPAFLVRMLVDRTCSVYDIGLTNQTEADGLAVAQASELVFDLVNRLIDGLYTVEDHELFEVLVRLERVTGLRIEPSSAAAFLGPLRMNAAGPTRYCQRHGIDPALVTHVFWTTGGSFVPDDEYWQFHARGEALLTNKGALDA